MADSLAELRHVHAVQFAPRMLSKLILYTAKRPPKESIETYLEKEVLTIFLVSPNLEKAKRSPPAILKLFFSNYSKSNIVIPAPDL